MTAHGGTRSQNSQPALLSPGKPEMDEAARQTEVRRVVAGYDQSLETDANTAPGGAWRTGRYRVLVRPIVRVGDE
jgi:hypothetical protein